MPGLRLRTLGINLGVALASLGVALLAAEGALRLAGVQSLNADQAQLITEYDSLLGWRKRPLASGAFSTSEYTVTETLNSHGLRGPELSYDKPRGSFRILLLGDSFVEGYTVDGDSTCGRVLERRLHAQGDQRYEVINGGTGGYSTDQQLLFFETEGRRYHPDLTILLFYVNDVWYNSQARYWRGFKPLFALADGRLTLTNVPVPKPDPDAFAFAIHGGTGLTARVRRADAWLGVHSRLYGFVRGAVKESPALSGLAIRLGWAAVPDEWRAWKRTEDPALRHAWELTEAMLGRLQRSSAEIGSGFAILYVPSRPAIYADDWRVTKRKYAMSDAAWSPDQDAVELARICAQRRIPCINPVARYRAEADRLRSRGDRLYFLRDAHWNAAGHRLAGEILADYAQSLLGPARAAPPTTRSR